MMVELKLFMNDREGVGTFLNDFKSGKARVRLFPKSQEEKVAFDRLSPGMLKYVKDFDGLDVFNHIFACFPYPIIFEVEDFFAEDYFTIVGFFVPVLCGPFVVMAGVFIRPRLRGHGIGQAFAKELVRFYGNSLVWITENQSASMMVALKGGLNVVDYWQEYVVCSKTYSDQLQDYVYVGV